MGTKIAPKTLFNLRKNQPIPQYPFDPIPAHLIRHLELRRRHPLIDEMLEKNSIRRKLGTAAQDQFTPHPSITHPLPVTLKVIKGIAHKLSRPVHAPHRIRPVVIRRAIPMFIDKPRTIQVKPEQDIRLDRLPIRKLPLPGPMTGEETHKARVKPRELRLGGVPCPDLVWYLRFARFWRGPLPPGPHSNQTPHLENKYIFHPPISLRPIKPTIKFNASYPIFNGPQFKIFSVGLPEIRPPWL